MKFLAGRWLAVAILLLVSAAVVIGRGEVISVAQAQGAACTPGRDCCVVAASMEEPKRYAVVCDQGAQTAQNAAAQSGYPVIVHGPSTYDDCGTWMAAANIPGWAQYRSATAQPGAPAPAKPESKCTLGKNCCYIGGNNEQPPRYAIGYDGAASSGSHNLSVGGYTTILFGPVSTEACHAWWNDNIAAGTGRTFPPAPSGAVPFPPGTFAGKGPKPSSACTDGKNCCYVGAKDSLIGSGTATRTEYAIAYDGAASTAFHSLNSSGYHVVFGPVSTEACHGWWNDNIAARGLGSPFPAAPAGSIGFAPGTFRQGGAFGSLGGARASIDLCDFEKAKAAIEALPQGSERDGLAQAYEAAYAREMRTNALWQEASGLSAQGRRADALQLLNQALANTRCSSYRGRIEATIARLQPTAAPSARPPAPPVAPPPETVTAMEDQCNKLHTKAVWASIHASMTAAAAVLKSVPVYRNGVYVGSRRDYSEELASYNEALALYRQGAAMCREGRFPALFAKGIEDTTRELARPRR